MPLCIPEHQYPTQVHVQASELGLSAMMVNPVAVCAVMTQV